MLVNILLQLVPTPIQKPVFVEISTFWSEILLGDDFFQDLSRGLVNKTWNPQGLGFSGKSSI